MGWDSLVKEPNSIPITPAQREELERRWRAYQEAPDEGMLWEEFEKSLLDE